MNPIAIWYKYKNYGDWCYDYIIPTKEEFVEGFKYEFAELTITRTKEGRTRPFVPSVDFEIEPFWKEYTVGNNNDHKRVQKWLESYLENGYIRVKKAKENNMKENTYISKVEKSKYKLNFNLIKPNLKILSNLYDTTNKLKKIIPKYLSIVDVINKYFKRFTSIKEGWSPIWTIEGREVRLKNFIKQPKKSPNRLVYIATKDNKQIARVTWKEANEKITTQLADEPEWMYLSKKEGKKRMRPIAGNSLIPARGDEFYKPRKKYPKGKSSTKRVLTTNGYKSKRSHPGRNNNLKEVLWDVTLSKHNPNSIGSVNECKFKVKALNKQGAIDKAWCEFVPLSDVKLNNIRPFYKAVVERSIENNTIDQPKGDRSMVSLLEPKKQVLITKMKDGSKKIEEIITYKRKYPKLKAPWDTNKQEKKKKWREKDHEVKSKIKVKKIRIPKRHRTEEQIKLQRKKYVLNNKSKK